MGVEIHVDPLGVDEDSDANLVFLTHPHYDNFSEDDIARVRDSNTVVVAPTSTRRLRCVSDPRIQRRQAIPYTRARVARIRVHDR